MKDVGLGHVADFGQPQVDRIAADEDLPGAGVFHPGQTFEERRLARPTGADQGDELTRRNAQMGGLQDPSFADVDGDTRGRQARAALVADHQLAAVDVEGEGADTGDGVRSEGLPSPDQLTVEAHSIA